MLALQAYQRGKTRLPVPNIGFDIEIIARIADRFTVHGSERAQFSFALQFLTHDLVRDGMLIHDLLARMGYQVGGQRRNLIGDVPSPETILLSVDRISTGCSP